MTSEQKISRMYRRFGESQSGKKCKDCSNLIRVERGNHRVSKCLVYGDTFSEASDWKGCIHVNKNSSIEFKRKFIADLAETLMKNRMVMSGQQLQTLLNMNNILTSHGYDYAENGGRGVHGLISKVWAYYYKKKEFQIAYNIARAFVNQNGDYAYDM